MKGEIWKDIEGYEGKYQVSNMGNVKSLNYNRTGKEKIMKPYDDGHGYLRVDLVKDGKRKNCRINRLVAIAFLENPYNLPEVNHKDEDKNNNKVENLEWCTSKQNCNYGTRNERVAEKMRGRKLSEEHKKKIAEKNTNNPKLSKPVIGIDRIIGLIVEFPSVIEASRQTGIDKGNICACLKGRYKTAGGFYWMYANDADAE